MMKRVLTCLCACLMLATGFAVTVYADVLSTEDSESSFLGEMLFDTERNVNSFYVNNAAFKTTSVAGEACARLSCYASHWGYVHSPEVPVRMQCDQARYAVIKCYNPQESRSLGLIWRNQVSAQGYNTDDPISLRVESNAAGWQYLVVDMSEHALWSGILYDFGFMIYNDTAAYGEPIWLQWVKFYSEDPSEIYANVTEIPGISTEDTAIIWPDSTMPYYPITSEAPITELPEPMTSDSEPITENTDWETYRTQVDHDLWVDVDPPSGDSPAGLFFEVFGTPEELGCQNVLLGCKGGGCSSVAGGMIILALVMAGFVFRKKED